MPRARDHPVDGPGSDDLARAETVPVMHLAAIEVRDGGEADVRVGAHAEAGFDDELLAGPN